MHLIYAAIGFYREKNQHLFLSVIRTRFDNLAESAAHIGLEFCSKALLIILYTQHVASAPLVVTRQFRIKSACKKNVFISIPLSDRILLRYSHTRTLLHVIYNIFCTDFSPPAQSLYTLIICYWSSAPLPITAVSNAHGHSSHVRLLRAFR